MLELNTTAMLLANLTTLVALAIPTLIAIAVIQREKRLRFWPKVALVLLSVLIPMFGPMLVIATLLLAYTQRPTARASRD